MYLTYPNSVYFEIKQKKKTKKNNSKNGYKKKQKLRSKQRSQSRENKFITLHNGYDIRDIKIHSKKL